MSNSAKLITKVLEGYHHFLEAKKMGVQSAIFISPLDGKIWRFIEEYVEAHGVVPPLEKIKKKFPSFDFIDPGDRPLSEIFEDFSGEVVELKIRTGLVDLEDALIRGDYKEALSILSRTTSESSKNYALSPDMTLTEASQQLMDRYYKAKTGQLVYDIEWPWRPLQEATGGIEPGTFTVFYGRPKSTKTWRLLEVACAARRAGKKALVVSLEMQEETLFNRIAAIDCGINYSKLRYGELSQEEEEKMIQYFLEQQEDDSGNNIVVTLLANEGEARTVSALRAKIDQHQPDIVLIDSMYKMTAEQTGKADAKPETIRLITNDIQHIASADRIPIVITSQANREGEKVRANTTKDAAFSDSFGMDCDLMLRIVNDTEIGRTVFLVQAAREIMVDGFSTCNSCADNLGPYMRSDGVEDWSIPSKYTGSGEKESTSGDASRFR